MHSVRKDRLGVAVVGYGRIAVAHLTELQRLKDRARLVAVVSRRPEAAREGHRRFGTLRYYTDYEAALDDRDIDAVVVCTPHHMHSRMVVQGAQAGKHVLVEKPLATSLPEADEAIAAANKFHVNLMVAYNQRFLRAVMEAKDRMTAIGDPTNIVQIRATSFPAASIPAWWRESRLTGGFVLPLAGSHLIDTCLWWVGQRPEQVFAQAHRRGEVAEGEDTATVSLSFPGGLLASVHLSYNAKVAVSERIVVGTAGVLRISDGTLRVNEKVVLRETVPPHSRGGPSFRRQLMEFINSIVERREPLASGRETRATVEVLVAARRSLAERCPVNCREDCAEAEPIVPRGQRD
jgi:predicted dehydrogenase